MMYDCIIVVWVGLYVALTNTYSLFYSVYWDYAMTIRLEEIVYLHCHQQGKIIQGKLIVSFDVHYLWTIHHYKLMTNIFTVFSGQWRHCGVGEPGWDPEASIPFSKRRPSAAVPHMSGDRTPSTWPAWSSSLVPEGKGGHWNQQLCLRFVVRKVLLLFLYNICNFYNFTGKGFPKITEKKPTQLLRVIFWQGWRWSNRLCVSDNISRQSGVWYVAQSNGIWLYCGHMLYAVCCAVTVVWTFVVTYLLFLHLVYTFHPVLCTSFLFL